VPLLRPCSGALATALAGGVEFLGTDLFTVTLQTGTVYRWTSWDSDLVVSGHTFTSSGQWLQRGRWQVVNTMQVPTLEVTILTNAASFGGSGLSLRTQLHNGLFDGATLLLQRLYMPTAGDTSTWGTVNLFSGDVGAVQLSGAEAKLKIRGKSSRLSVNAPRNVYQPGCVHTFCDSGCTLNAATFTSSFTVLTATRTSVALTGAPSNPMQGGTLTMTSGAATGEVRGVVLSIGFLIGVSYPFYVTPSPGDTLTLFSACDKTIATCTNVYNNKVNFRGFPFVPPPATAAVGQ
jgi:uncharacterized phage protein (TIGR02218 family)